MLEASTPRRAAVSRTVNIATFLATGKIYQPGYIFHKLRFSVLFPRFLRKTPQGRYFSLDKIPQGGYYFDVRPMLTRAERGMRDLGREEVDDGRRIT